MRFKTRGTFETEAIIDIAQRVMAQVQEAGVDHVAGFNIYLTPTDAAGKHRRFVKDGLEIDHIDVETWDLTVPEPEESSMTSVYANEPTTKAKPAHRHNSKSPAPRSRKQSS